VTVVPLVALEDGLTKCEVWRRWKVEKERVFGIGNINENGKKIHIF
jgi:hypothetical protein